MLTRGWSEREPAHSLRDRSNVIGGWLPSLTFKFAFTSVKRLVIAGGLILAVVIAFGVYRFYHAARIKASQPCWNTLAQIDSAKQQWALESGATSGAPVTLESILPYLRSAPTCHVAGTTYIIGKVGEEPRCTFHGTISHFNPDLY
jgi:hypothetical protein